MKLFSTFFATRIASAAVLLVLGLPTLALAQRALGAKSIILDDGAGNISTLVASPGGNGTITLPSGTGTLSIGGFVPAFLNAYTTSGAVTIPVGGEIPVTTVAGISGFISDGFGGFAVSAAGVYNVEYTVARDEASSLAISVNGITAPNSVFGCATGTTVVHGNAFLFLSVGDVIKLISSPNNTTAITLESVVTGTVAASLTAARIE